MGQDSDDERIRRKAHELWEADGRRHGLDQSHWDQAKEIIAIEDSQADTLLPRDTGAAEPVEDADEALRNLGDFPNLTDQGENLLTSTDREPTFAGEPDGMPSVEVPASNQPGISTQGRRAASKPDQDMKASPKNNAPPLGKSTGKKQPASQPPASPASKTGAEAPKANKPAGSGPKKR